MNENDQNRDDLTAIKGVGPTRQQWLQESLGVQTVRELAALSVADIETQLKREGHTLPRSEIERWLAQARDLAETAPVSSQVRSTGAETANQPTHNPTKPQSASSASQSSVASSKDAKTWELLAQFVVYYQTRSGAGPEPHRQTVVHHMEADRDEVWPGFDSKRLCAWMIEQAEQAARKREQRLGKKPPAEPRVRPVTPATVVIKEIAAYQPPQARSPLARSQAKEPFLGVLKSDEPFALTVCFTLSGGTADELEKQGRSYQAQFYARNLFTRANIHLGDTPPQSWSSGAMGYTATLSEARLPVGMYRLQALIISPGPPIGPGYLEVPMVEVR